MDLSFLDIKTVITIVHLFGVVLGAGGAFMSDAMFFKSVKDERISKTEISFLELGSSLVIGGLILLILSGAGLFFLDPSGYLASNKFLAKMSIVGVIIINGIVFHKAHLPRILRHADHHFPSSDEFMRHRTLLLSSGAISMTSWAFAIILGSLRSIPFSYEFIMMVYGAAIASAIGIAMLIKNYILPHHKK